MSASHPSLSIPYLPELNTVAPTDITSILDIKGVSLNVDCINWPAEYPYHPLTEISIAHSGRSIFVNFQVRGNYLRAVNHTNNSHVHQDSCVEFFLAPKGRTPYYNFEFNCIGTVHTACRMDRHNGAPLTDAQLDTIKRYPSYGTRPFEEMEGFFAWNLLVEIPLELIGVKYEGTPIHMMGNFYKCADLTTAPHFVSWAPIATPEPDFHRPEFFAPITLE